MGYEGARIFYRINVGAQATKLHATKNTSSFVHCVERCGYLLAFLAFYIRAAADFCSTKVAQLLFVTHHPHAHAHARS
jgi:hypothetical protein